MTFILRWPAILVLFALVLLSGLGAIAAAGALSGFDPGIAQIEEARESAVAAGAGQATWIDVGLWAGAAIFFLISAIRLIRRTQGFWTWLLGFALYGGRWAYSQSSDDLLARLQAIDINLYLQPQSLLADPTSTEAQVAILGIVFVVGLLILIVDGADRAYWDKHEA